MAAQEGSDGHREKIEGTKKRPFTAETLGTQRKARAEEIMRSVRRNAEESEEVEERWWEQFSGYFWFL